MTSRQIKFTQLVAAGKPQRDAYLESYPASAKWTRKTVNEKASRLAHKLSDQIALLRAEAAKNVRLTREKKLAGIETIIDQLTGEREYKLLLDYLKLHNEMTGDNAPQKIEANVDILSVIAARRIEVIRDER